MADDKNKKKTKEPAAASEKEKPQAATSAKRSKLKLILIIFVLLVLLGAGFAAGVFFKIIDINAMGQKLKLHEYPVVGRYFEPPKTNFETVDTENTDLEVPNVEEVKPLTETPAPPIVNEAPAPAAATPNPTPIDPVEKMKLEKARQQEEAKRIGRLARLYGAMKPKEAVAVLSQLDDDTILSILGKMEEEQVSKILATFDAKRAAQLTDKMFKNRKDTVL